MTRMIYCSSPLVLVSPSYKEALVGDEFDVDISIDYVSHLYGFEFWMSFDENILNASTIDYRGYLNEPTNVWYQEVNNTVGYVTLAVSSHLPASGKTGGSPPPLATVHFKALNRGDCLLHLIENKTILVDDQGYAVAHTTADGTVHVTGGVHDIQTQNLTSLKGAVGQGYLNNFTVTVRNHGDFQETFNVSVRANATELIRKEVTVPSGNSSSIILVWNSTGFPYGNFSISAYAWPVQNETNTSDNTLVDGRLIVGIPGDIKTDGVVNILDAIKLGNAFNARPGSSTWNPDADINGDGVVNILDAIVLGNHFLQHQLYDP